MASTAIIRLTSNAGTIEFSASTGYEPPLISQRLEAIRGTEQGSSLQKVSCQLSGFFEGDSNASIQSKIAELTDILQSNELTLYYHDGAREVINRQVWLVDQSDPLEWKQYNSQYTINCYYFRPANHAASAIEVTYQTDLGTYTFDPAPSIARSYKQNRKSMRESGLSVSGVDLGNMVQVVLEGFLEAETPEALNTKRVALQSAFNLDGTLNFGSYYSVAVRAIEQNIPNVYPQTFLNYTLTVGYDTSDITELEIRREYSRVHNNPLIKEWPYCPNRPVAIERNESAQVVSYSFKASGYNLSVIRSFLENEASVVVHAGGTELPGGSEEETIRGGDPSVTVRFAKFHADAVRSNLTNT